MPTTRELNRRGRGDLRHAITRSGGTHAWAERLGLEIRPGQDRTAYGPHDARADAREVIRALGLLPHAAAARKLGYGQLATFMEYAGGKASFLRQVEPLRETPDPQGLAERRR